MAGGVMAEDAGPFLGFLRWCGMALVVAGPLIVVATLLHPSRETAGTMPRGEAKSPDDLCNGRCAISHRRHEFVADRDRDQVRDSHERQPDGAENRRQNHHRSAARRVS
jgi:hypothetical protein